MDMYLPNLAGGQFVRNYFFKHPELGPCSVVLVTDCQSNLPVQYTHVMYVYEKGDFLTGKPRYAVASEVNRMATPGEERSHFLGVFTQGNHLNLGASNDWADLEKFASKALTVIQEHYSLTQLPQEIEVPTIMRQRFQVPQTMITKNEIAPTKIKKKWWQFWK
jgi:hypothetical protein